MVVVQAVVLIVTQAAVAVARVPSVALDKVDPYLETAVQVVMELPMIIQVHQ
jgi:hypothetical protein